MLDEREVADGLLSSKRWQAQRATCTFGKFDDATISDKVLRLSTLNRCSFSRATLDRVTFNHSRFNDCYFRNATFKHVEFVGCRFKDCVFDGAVFELCDFSHAEFENCALDNQQMHHVLHNHPNHHNNIRWRLAQSMRVNAQQRGEYNEARELLLAELRAEEKHQFRIAFWLEDEDPKLRKYYTWERFKLGARISAARKWIWLAINSRLTGHGEMPGRIVKVSAVVAVFFAFAYRFSGQFSPSPAPQPQSFADYLSMSADYFAMSAAALAGFSYGNVQAVSPVARNLATAEALVGLFLFGLFVSALFRRISKR